MQIFQQHFQKLFSSKATYEDGNTLAMVSRVISTEMNENLCKDITDLEIKEAASQLGATKAPGPDGFS